MSESTNLRDWISGTLQYFLLRQARIGGKEALKPLVPTNNDGTIKTTAVSWVFTFTEQHIIPDSFEITYTPLADRKAFCAVMLWRQQDDLGIPVMRNTEVRYTGTAVDGPYEQHDLSEFCSTENHAVKVGAYIISKRRHVTHRLQLGVKPDAFNPTLGAGDLVRVRLERIASTGADSVHDYLYEVDRIGKSITGEVQLDLTHFPVDANLASVVALEVNAATGSGLLLPTGLSGITCDVNSSGDTSVPAETFTDGTFSDYGSNISDFGGGDSEFGDGDNPADGLDGQSTPSGSPPALTSTGNINVPVVGDTLTAPTICDGGQVVFYRLDPSVPSGKVIAAQATSTYTIVINDLDKSVYAEISCPDPTSPTGYGDPIRSEIVTINFIPTPETITANAILTIYNYTSDKIYCFDGATIAIPEAVNSYVTELNVPNVVGYMPINSSITQLVVCSDTEYTETIVKPFGVLLKKTDGTRITAGGSVNEGTVFSTSVSGTNITYANVYLSYGSGIFLYETPAIPGPPTLNP